MDELIARNKELEEENQLLRNALVKNNESLRVMLDRIVPEFHELRDRVNRLKVPPLRPGPRGWGDADWCPGVLVEHEWPHAGQCQVTPAYPL